jgi:hypothetical protein
MEHGTMTKKQEVKNCFGCGEKKSVTRIAGVDICSECATLAAAIKDNPLLLKRISAIVQPDVSLEIAHETKDEHAPPRELPEVLDAVRFRTRDRELNTWYVSVSELDGNPVEIFASTAFDRD